jgi:hypothetical protein
MSQVRHRGARKARSRLAGALAVGAIAGLGAATPAAAEEGPVIPDPLTTNIPYTAWSGTQLRLVKCSEDLRGIPASGIEVAVESWSGDANYRPTVFQQSISKVNARCARANVVSLGDGLARIKLKAFEDERPRDEILEHQFLAIWMRLGEPTIDEVGANDPTGGPEGSLSEVGDPAGDGAFLPSSRNGRVQVFVTGSFPHPLGPGGRFTLPDDWATLAEALATDSNPSTEDDSMRWDIHDDLAKTEGHVPGRCDLSPAPIDAVDNCRGDERFSRFFGDLVGGPDSWGPFDPLRLDTLLTDGKLDAGDAPMPAARVDFTIAANTDPDDDIGGAGALEPASKREVYSRDGNGTASPHNLYAPYYTQWVPATSAEDVDPTASGTDWYVQNNFGGLEQFGPYDNWDTFTLTEHDTEATSCNRTVAFPGGAYADDPRLTPSGDRRVAVFTDEHGEAQVEYEPYAGGFYYDAVGAILNDNRGCDLQDVETLGTSVISATARYPGQPVDFPPMTSDTVTKTVGNEFDKSIRYYPKGAGAANQNARIVVAHGQDVDGTAFAGERVCFYVDDEADSYRLFSGETGPATGRFVVDTDQAATPSGIHPDVRCAYLDENGNAALEVFNSDPQSINVIAEYVDEGLLRDRDVEFGTPDSGDPDPPPTTNPGDEEPESNAGTTPPTIQQIIQTVGTNNAGHLLAGAKDATRSGARARIASSRIVRKSTGRYLVVKVVSTSSRATVKVRMKMRNGSTRKASRSVRTNRSVRVMRLSNAVKSVKVNLAK